MIGKIYTSLLNYSFSYELQKPSYEDVNYNSLAHRDGQERRPLSRQALVLQDLASHEATYVDSLNTKLVRTIQVFCSSLGTESHSHYVHDDYIPTFLQSFHVFTRHVYGLKKRCHLKPYIVRWSTQPLYMQ